GRIAVGCDADLVAFAPDEVVTVDPDRLFHRHKVTPYAGMELTGAVLATWLGGVPVDASPRGRLLSREVVGWIRLSVCPISPRAGGAGAWCTPTTSSSRRRTTSCGRKRRCSSLRRSVPRGRSTTGGRLAGGAARVVLTGRS